MTKVIMNKGIDLNTKKTVRNPFVKKQQKPVSEEDIKKQVSTAIEKVGGKYIKVDNIDHTEGLLVAGVLDKSEIEKTSPEDSVYFAVMNRDKKMVYINTKEHFSILKDIPASLYILNYLYTREPDTILAYAEHAFEKDKVDVFTKICIKVPEKKAKANKTNNKSKTK